MLRSIMTLGAAVLLAATPAIVQVAKFPPSFRSQEVTANGATLTDTRYVDADPRR